MILCVELAGDLTLQFQILETPLAQLWLDCMRQRDQYPLDDPKRFVGFNDQAQEEQISVEFITHCVRTINQYRNIIDREFTNIHDQDTLNYLHSIFETFHGHLDQQRSNNFFALAPPQVKQALADLNVAVHRCESVARGRRPRFTCTWYGLPKIKTLTDDLIQQHGTMQSTFGTVYLNYCEIGKTLESLMQDRDNYITDEAFKPFNYYSADFTARFWDEDFSVKLPAMNQYYQDNLSFFQARGYNQFDHPRLLPYNFPVAQLIETSSREQLLMQIQQQQQINRVYIK
jgi:hypothetical protein